MDRIGHFRISSCGWEAEHYAAFWGALSVAMHSISFDERDSAGSGLLSLAKPASQQACRSALNMTFRYSGVFFRPRCSSSTHVRRPLRNEVTWPNCPHGGAAAGAALRLVVAFNAGRGSIFPLMTVRRRHLGWPSGCGWNSSMPAGRPRSQAHDARHRR
jgi:hypothetical protein